MESLHELEIRERWLLDQYNRVVFENPSNALGIERALAEVQENIRRTAALRELYVRCVAAVEGVRNPALEEEAKMIRAWLVSGVGQKRFRRIIDLAMSVHRDSPVLRVLEANARMYIRALDVLSGSDEKDVLALVRDVPGDILLNSIEGREGGAPPRA